MLDIFVDLSSESNYLNENSSIYVALIAIVLLAIRTQKDSSDFGFYEKKRRNRSILICERFL